MGLDPALPHVVADAAARVLREVSYVLPVFASEARIDTTTIDFEIGMALETYGIKTGGGVFDEE